jgi:hypothetical protein
MLSSLFTPGATHTNFTCIVVGLDTRRKKENIEALFLNLCFLMKNFQERSKNCEK